MTRALEAGKLALGREGEPALDAAFRRAGHALLGAGQRTFPGLRQVFRQVHNEHLRVGCPARSDYVTLKGQRVALARAVAANVAADPNPPFLEGPLDFIGAGSGVSSRAGSQHGEIFTIVIARVVLLYSDGMNRSAHADAAKRSEERR